MQTYTSMVGFSRAHSRKPRISFLGGSEGALVDLSTIRRSFCGVALTVVLAFSGCGDLGGTQVFLTLNAGVLHP